MTAKTDKGYWPNGQLKYEWPQRDGKYYGLCRSWYESGRLSFKCTYVNYQRHGIVQDWWENGKSRYEYYYLYGTPVTQEEYRKHELIEQLAGI